ncbi:hypothetical protein ACFX2H_009829 [Malus domestica]|uniref:Glycoside hydrolase family 3 N-terminal domain-containing protein n=1 Tax=Malus domestica TaxID=3750 RepID=A0A498IFP0_MALDO|nr:hypothetical protein DVH24_036190 [Malus domestica]
MLVEIKGLQLVQSTSLVMVAQARALMSTTLVDQQELLSIHMPAYSDSIIKGVSTVKISYSSWNGKKMHANHDLIKDFLKGILKFKGFVISDWEGIDRITSQPANESLLPKCKVEQSKTL